MIWIARARRPSRRGCYIFATSVDICRPRDLQDQMESIARFYGQVTENSDWSISLIDVLVRGRDSLVSPIRAHEALLSADLDDQFWPC